MGFVLLVSLTKLFVGTHWSSLEAFHFRQEEYVDRETLRNSLQQVLNLAYAKAKPPTGAWVKEQLRREVGEFNEEELGYTSFLELLESFDDLVEIRRRPGSDFVVELRDQIELFPLSEVGSDMGVPFVRSDLWQAFAFVRDAEETWCFDRDAGKARKLEELEPGTSTESSRFVEIPSLDSDELRGWMEGFADAWPEETVSEALNETLTDPDQWLWNFNSRLSALSDEVQEAWRRKRAFHVINRVQTWAEENDVEVGSIVQDRSPRDTADRDIRSESEAYLGERERILEILKKVPTSELRRIRLPVGLVLELDSE